MNLKSVASILGLAMMLQLAASNPNLTLSGGAPLNGDGGQPKCTGGTIGKNCPKSDWFLKGSRRYTAYRSVESDSQKVATAGASTTACTDIPNCYEVVYIPPVTGCINPAPPIEVD